MTRPDSERQPDNRLLYKYIQLAYEYVNRSADESVEGDTVAFE